MKIRDMQRLGILLLLCLISIPTAAHTFYTALTRINYNGHAKTIEVIHRVTGHDLEAVLSFHEGTVLGFEDNPELAEMAGAYLKAHFTIDADGSNVPLQFIGLEPSGEDILVYFEGACPDLPRDISVTNTIFLEELPQQTNTVVATIGDRRGAGRFSSGEDRKSLDLR